jgi:hypothetical protein
MLVGANHGRMRAKSARRGETAMTTKTVHSGMAYFSIEAKAQVHSLWQGAQSVRKD